MNVCWHICWHRTVFANYVKRATKRPQFVQLLTLDQHGRETSDPAEVIAAQSDCAQPCSCRDRTKRVPVVQLLLLFTLKRAPNKPLCFVRYLEIDPDNGFNEEGDTEPVFTTLKYAALPEAKKLSGAEKKYAKKPWCVVGPISAIAHRLHLVPSPSLWLPSDRGKDIVCQQWYQNRDLLWHSSSL